MGVESVRAELVAGAAAAVRDERDQAAGQQLELISTPATRRLSAEEARTEGEARRGRGRPKGSENLMTRDLRKLLLAQGGLPQAWQMEWSSLEPEELAARLGCTRLEAFDRIAKIKAELGAYFMPKLAPTDASGAVVPPIALFIGGQQAGGGERPPWLRTLEGSANDIERNQALSGSLLANANANPDSEDE